MSILKRFAESGQLIAQQNFYLEEAKRTGDTALIHEYTEVAQANGFSIQTQKIYEAILAMQPQNYVAMRQAGVAEFDRADYAASKDYLGKYIAHYKAQPVDDSEAYLAFFYYAEILRGQDNMKEALPYYNSALKLMEGHELTTANRWSVKAQAEVWTGNVDGGLKLFDDARQKFPADKELRADLVTTLLNIKQYDKARGLLAADPRKAGKKAVVVATPVPYSWIPTFNTPVTALALYRNNHELLVRFANHLNSFDIQKLKGLRWVSYASDGWDTLLITTAPGFRFENIPSATYPDNGEASTKSIKPVNTAAKLKTKSSGVSKREPFDKKVTAVSVVAPKPESGKDVDEADNASNDKKDRESGCGYTGT